jgi:pilus assembly protein CpaD
MMLPDDAAGRRGSRPRLATALVLSALAAGALAGCAKGPTTTGAIPSDGYRTNYPIVLAEGEETFDIPVGFGTAGLSPTMRENLRAFGADAARYATSTVVIQTPAGSGNQAAAQHVAREARAELLRSGLAKSLIETRQYPVGDSGAAAPVRVSFSRIKATSPECGKWNGPLMPDWQNGDVAEFGCASQANFAAMLENPEDVLHPRPSTPTPAGRRYFIWKQWLESGETATGQELESTNITGDGA